ncbi:histidine kinase dimerization/phospho-acceptor domain-containing protein [uncultured Senegalimassilia sp.]|uniref:histidine kinase dimerization/phospho-acceptor domain-containing protein n=1 Tax=uncultured Senegalimassilia sp. TaxID=1714350 RepID=UPI0026E0D085|nr:histidine kinase dimerization/phospho-acceptor domain-containing protein [uncultured Senegalimassilia sp.]
MRNDFLEALLKLFQENPGAEASVAALCAKAGYSRSTFYRYFDSLPEAHEALEDRVVPTGVLQALVAGGDAVGMEDITGAFLGYQATVTRATLTLGAALVAALVRSAYRAQVSAQKAPFETERRRLQAKSMHELEAAKAKADAANKSRSEFLANMSHDIRTPMNAIVGLTKLMEHDKDDPEKMDAYLHKIQTSSQHLLSLINDVLDMSKIESSEVTLGREPISLADQVAQIDSIIRSQAESRSQTFTIRVHELTHEHFIGDAMRLRQLHHLSRRSHAA